MFIPRRNEIIIMESLYKVIEVEENRFTPSVGENYLRFKNKGKSDIKYIYTKKIERLYSEKECIDILKDDCKIHMEEYCPKLGIPILELKDSEIKITYLDK